VDPYRAPQSLPPSPPDPMRPVLIGAGVVAGMIAVAAITIYVVERFERPAVAASKIAKIDRTKTTDAPPPEPRPARPYNIPQGIVIDAAVHGDVGPNYSSNVTDLSFAIFPAGESKHAITMFKTQYGHHEVELLARSYDLCWGGDPKPVCTLEVEGRDTRVKSCPSNALDCTCTSADDRRLAWRAGCERVRVDTVTHVSVGVGMAGPMHPGFVCDPADACTKTDVNPDAERR
jgi:hypothetical protein